MKSLISLATFVLLISLTEQLNYQQCVAKPAAVPCNAADGCDSSAHICVTVGGDRGCYPTCAGFIGRPCPPRLTCCYSYPGGVYKQTPPPNTADMPGICLLKPGLQQW